MKLGWNSWVFWMAAAGLISIPASMAAEETARPILTGQLLYSRLTNGTWQIWKTNLATRQQVQLTSSPGDKRYPAWTPKGQVTYHTSNHRCYWVETGKPDKPFLDDLWPIRDIAWSPDGAKIAFSRFRTDLVDSANLWIADAAGGKERMITHEAGIQYQPAWSPDGKWIAYIGGHGYGTYELYVVSEDGTERRQLTQNRTHEFLPAWSPDGAQIAFSSDTSGDYEIWVMQADGSNARQLTRSPGLDTRPTWSPDGTKIVFVTNRSGFLEIWAMNPDCTEQHLLEKAQGGVCDPVWR